MKKVSTISCFPWDSYLKKVPRTELQLGEDKEKTIYLFEKTRLM